jgi:anti-sigma28 factor (negative regulator of flagellin synthesis)
LGNAKRKAAKKNQSDGGTACVDRPTQSRGARKLRLDRIRQEIENGTYETEGKLRIAVSRLIDDVLERSRKGQD